jgi:hypothetical protein
MATGNESGEALEPHFTVYRTESTVDSILRIILLISSFLPIGVRCHDALSWREFVPAAKVRKNKFSYARFGAALLRPHSMFYVYAVLHRYPDG